MNAATRKKYPKLQDVAADPAYLIEPKYDGVHGVCVIAEDGGKMLSRDNKEYFAVNHIIADVHKVFGKGWVVFGEIYKFDTPQKVISGMARRHNDEPTLMFVVYDAVPLLDFQDGMCPTPYEERRRRIKDVTANRAPDSLIIGAYHEAVGVDPDTYALGLKERGGYDGGMLKNRNAPWKPGACKCGEAIKIKPQITLDLRVVGMEEGKGKQKGMMGSILVEYRGAITKVGSGYTDEERLAWWARRHTDWRSSMNVYIVEVKCLEVNSSNVLREPIFVSERHDKPKAD